MSTLTEVRLPQRDELSGGRVVEVLTAAGSVLDAAQEVLILQVGERTLRFRSPNAGTLQAVLPVMSEPAPGDVLFKLAIDDAEPAPDTTTRAEGETPAAQPPDHQALPRWRRLLSWLWQLKWYALGFGLVFGYVFLGD